MANTTVGIVNGTDIGIYVGTKLIALATSHTIKLTANTRNITTKDSADFEEAEYSRFSWEMSVKAMTSYDTSTTKQTSDDLLTAMLAKTKLTVKYSTNKTGDRVFSGTVIITEFSEDAPDAENTTYSVTLKGTGALAKAVVAGA